MILKGIQGYREQKESYTYHNGFETISLETVVREGLHMFVNEALTLSFLMTQV